MVPCPLCMQDVNWVTVGAAAKLLGVSPQRIRQFINAGRFPNALKLRPDHGSSPMWKLPIKDVIAVKAARDGS